MDDNATVHFNFNGYGRDITISLDGDEADYLPRLLAAFADFLRCAGFTYVDVEPHEGGWLFHKHYDAKTEDDSWSRVDTSEFFRLLDEQDEVNQAADDYWDQAIDKAMSEDLFHGDEVFYHGKGTLEQTLNRNEQPQGHGGHTGVTLVNMKGTVIKTHEGPTGNRVLVKWNNWNDGHNGLGDDPEAKMGATNYWWSNVNNMSRTN